MTLAPRLTSSVCVLVGVVALLTGCANAAPPPGGASSPADPPTVATIGGASVVCDAYRTTGDDVDASAPAQAIGFALPAGADCVIGYESTSSGHTAFAAVYHDQGAVAAWSSAGTAGGWVLSPDSNDKGALFTRGDDIITVLTIPEDESQGIGPGIVQVGIDVTP